MGVLDGKVAIVTGAGNGIGREHALLFAREGARVVVNDPGGDRHGAGSSNAADRVVEEIRSAGGEAVASLEPVGSPQAAEAIVGAAVREFGAVDVLVNNAGILRDRTLLKTTEEDWDRVLEVHLKGSFFTTQAAARRMIEQGRGGRVIHTSSGSGLLGNFGQSNYGAAKAAIWALTRIGAIELARHSITVNAIAPIARTRMTEDLPGYRDLDPEANREAQGPQHIAPLVAFLASDQAAGITGEVFGVGGTRIFLYKMMCTRGIEKRGSTEPWTQEELLGSIDRITRI
ncbi:MAG TPA: SDR family NAD(P)-dependent oxidoreductase [Thermoanaerobaculia bacterium]|nr:SDR family NAD(P)-dependent oxidoreductase [Thermoanaerobaculia bacterium]